MDGILYGVDAGRRSLASNDIGNCINSSSVQIVDDKVRQLLNESAKRSFSNYDAGDHQSLLQKVALIFIIFYQQCEVFPLYSLQHLQVEKALPGKGIENQKLRILLWYS